MYRFEFRDEVGDFLGVSPIYGEDIKVTVTRPKGERYGRYDITGKFSFVGVDFEYFYDRPSEQFFFDLYWDEGKESTKIISAPFTLMDMELDLDNKIAVLDLEGKDQYEAFLEQLDSEYDLVQLAPPRNNVNLYRRAFLQLYVENDTKLTHVIGNTSYEVDAVEGADQKKPEDLDRMGFTLLAQQRNIFTFNFGSQIDAKYKDAETVYTYLPSGQIASPDGKYILVPQGAKHEIWLRKEQLYIGVWMYLPTKYQNQDIFKEDGTNIGWCKEDDRGVYGRIISNVDNDSTGGFQSDDIWQRNLNYAFYHKFNPNESIFQDIKDRIIISGATTDIPNQWMSNGFGRYFKQPSKVNPTEQVIAIGWNQWIPLSYWFRSDYSVATNVDNFSEQWQLRDAYDLRDCIRILLNKIDPNMTMRSVFLDNLGRNYNNPITGKKLWLYITPITNIKATYYEMAAQRGKITMKQILDMLKKCFKCYWFLEWVTDHWELRIEQEKWFMNGGSYSKPQPPAADFSRLIVPLTGKAWMTDQAKVNYDLGEVKSRVSLEWADKSSELFNGYPLVSNDFPKQPIEKLKVDNFYTDIDLIITSPEDLSNDLYVLIGADGEENGEKTVWLDKVGYFTDLYSNTIFVSQNSQMSFYYLEQKFHTYDADCAYTYITIEGVGNIEQLGSKKKIVHQKVKAPYVIKRADMCYDKFVTGTTITGTGLGLMNKISTNLFTQASEIDLMFNDEH